MGDKVTQGIEQWLSIGSKAVTVLFIPSLWVFHLYLDNRLNARFNDLKDELREEFVKQSDIYSFAKNDALTNFKTKTKSELQNTAAKIHINDAKVDSMQANTNIRLEAIKEDILEIKKILTKAYPQ
jgi:hypothetical protein